MHQIYKLEDGEALKRFPPPFSPDRLEYYRSASPGQAKSIPDGPEAMLFISDDAVLGRPGMHFGGPWSISSLLRFGAGVFPQEWKGGEELQKMEVPGDFVVRAGITPVQFVEALTMILRREFDMPTTLSLLEIERPVVLLRGSWAAKQVDGLAGNSMRQRIEIYGADLDADPTRGSGGGTGTLEEFGQWLGEWIQKPIVFEIANGPRDVQWHLNGAGNGTPQSRSLAHDPPRVLGHISEQTGLTWTEDVRKVRRLFAE